VTSLNAAIDINTGRSTTSHSVASDGHDITDPSEGGAMTTDKRDVTAEELDAETAEAIPDREAMSLIDANVAVPVNAAVAANVLTDESTADAAADQEGDIDQANVL